jgi:hypothetical protein
MWSSLEVTKLIVSSLTPILVIVIGFILNRKIKNLDSRQWTNQKILEKRLLIYDKTVPLLNDILCFHCYIGNWKEISPTEIIRTKRTLDKEMNIYSPLFNKELLDKYNKFIQLCYETFTGWGNDAKIKSLYERRAEHCKEWNHEENKCFSEEYIKSFLSNNDKENVNIAQKKKAYLDLMEEFKNGLEIMQSGVFQRISNPTVNFK